MKRPRVVLLPIESISCVAVRPLAVAALSVLLAALAPEPRILSAGGDTLAGIGLGDAARAEEGSREKLIGTFRINPSAPARDIAPGLEPGVATRGEGDRPLFLTGALGTTQSPEDTLRRDVGDRIFFVDGSTRISGRAVDIIEAQAEWLRRQPGLKLTIEGHADDGGTPADDLRLSEARAQAVRERLIAAGIEPMRMTIVARGREQRIALCSGGDCGVHNRRAVLVVHAVGAGPRIGLERAPGARKGGGAGSDQDGRRGDR